MKNELMIADDLIPSLKSGKKTCTIRKGKRDIDLGDMFFKAVNSGEVLKVNVTEVLHKTADQMTDDEAKLDGLNGAKTAAEMIIFMKRFYPDFESSTEITVIKYEPPKL